MGHWGQNARARLRLAVLLILLLSESYNTNFLIFAAEGSARALPVYAPERDLAAENRPVFGARKETPEKTRSQLKFSPRGRDDAPTPANAGKAPQSPNAANKKTGAVKTPRNPTWSYLPVLMLVLCLGCGMIIIYLKRWVPGGKSLFSSPALEVLGRTQIDRGKYLALVRAGKRILVVGVNPNGFDALSEITDPAEAAEVMMEARPQNKTGKNVFLDLFRQHIANDAAQTAVPRPGGEDAGLSALQARIRDLRQDEEGGRG